MILRFENDTLLRGQFRWKIAEKHEQPAQPSFGRLARVVVEIARNREPSEQNHRTSSIAVEGGTNEEE